MKTEAEDLATVAVALPGWQWMDGMQLDDGRLDYTHPATAGCLLELLGIGNFSWLGVWRVQLASGDLYSAPSLGEACIRAAIALGEWPMGVPFTTPRQP